MILLVAHSWYGDDRVHTQKAATVHLFLVPRLGDFTNTWQAPPPFESSDRLGRLAEVDETQHSNHARLVLCEKTQSSVWPAHFMPQKFPRTGAAFVVFTYRFSLRIQHSDIFVHMCPFASPLSGGQAPHRAALLCIDKRLTPTPPTVPPEPDRAFENLTPPLAR